MRLLVLIPLLTTLACSNEYDVKIAEHRRFADTEVARIEAARDRALMQTDPYLAFERIERRECRRWTSDRHKYVDCLHGIEEYRAHEHIHVR